MKVEIEEDKHIYYVNGNFADISVTELLKNQKLSPDYSKADKEILRESAEKGKQIHKDLENIFTQKKYECETEQGKRFNDYVKTYLIGGVPELKIGYKYKNMTIAGTCDLIAIDEDEKLIIADHKTTSVVHKESVAWQVSIYDYMLRKLGNEELNGKVIGWKGADKFLCYHHTDTEFKIVEIEKIPDEEIEKLFEAEYTGTKYQRPLLVIENELKEKIEQAEMCLTQIEYNYKQAKEQAENLRKELLKLMEKQKIKSWETDTLKVTYIGQTERLSVDSKKLKDRYIVAYTNCQKITKIKPSIRITIKGDNEEDE